MGKNNEVKNNTKEIKKETKKIKKEEKNVKNKEKNKVKINLNQKKYILLVVGIVILVLVIVFSVNLILKNKEYKKYEHYEAKMGSYGFSRLYNNGSAKTSESVTMSEAMKIVIGTCLNKFSIEDIAKKPTEDYDNAIWVLYAQDRELVSALELNKDTENKKAKYVDVIEYFASAKKIILEKELKEEPVKQIADLNEYDENEKKAILDMLSNDILKVAEENLDGNKKIFKGQLNELVVNTIEKYDLLGEKIQTDESKLPSNAKDFAYISANVDKKVYEIPTVVEIEESVKLPKDTYNNLKEVYKQIVNKYEEYYNLILNINYETLNAKEFEEIIDTYSVSLLDTEDYETYVSYVKENKIKISGIAKAQNPIIYYDGMKTRIRMKLDFKIESSLTDKNILFYDLLANIDVKYEENEYSIIIDSPLGSAMGTNTFYIKSLPVYSLMVGDENPKIYSIVE